MTAEEFLTNWMESKEPGWTLRSQIRMAPKLLVEVMNAYAEAREKELLEVK